MKSLFANITNKTTYHSGKMWEHIKAYIVPTIIILIFYLILYLLGNRSICIFKAIFGLPCPACGMTRAFTHCLAGEFKKAFFYHPLFLFSIIVFLVLLFRKNRIVSHVYKSNVFWITMFIIFMVVWVIRMFLLFPNNPPLDFNKNGLLPLIIRTVSKFISHMLLCGF